MKDVYINHTSGYYIIFIAASALLYLCSLIPDINIEQLITTLIAASTCLFSAIYNYYVEHIKDGAHIVLYKDRIEAYTFITNKSIFYYNDIEQVSIEQFSFYIKNAFLTIKLKENANFNEGLLAKIINGSNKILIGGYSVSLSFLDYDSEYILDELNKRIENGKE